MKSALKEADQAVNGPRQKSYGSPVDGFEKLAKMWSAFLGIQVSARQTAVMMVLLKVMRESHRHTWDNLVDMVGYAEIAGMCAQAEGPEPPSEVFYSKSVEEILKANDAGVTFAVPPKQEWR